MQLYDDLIKATPAQGGRDAVLVENCHWGLKRPFKPTQKWCPWNLYRTSGDILAKYASVVGNLRTMNYYANNNLSYPGCWAYPDMLEVGCDHGRHGARDPGLSETEAATHFAAWAIVSSPLILSHDVNNATVMDAVWPIISNREAIAVNQAWAGHSGSAFYRSPNTVTLGAVNHAAVQKGMGLPQLAALGPTVAPQHEYYYKPLEAGGKRTAVLLMNNGFNAADLRLAFKDIPGVKCTRCHVRDIWERRDLGNFDGSYLAKGVAPHAAPFLVITPSHHGGGGGRDHEEWRGAIPAAAALMAA